MSNTDTTVNTPRLLDLARWLTEQERKRRLGLPSEWDQGIWIGAHRSDQPVRVHREDDDVVIEGWTCGTAACAAGHISLEDGGMPAFWHDGDYSTTPPVSAYGGRIETAIGNAISDTYMYFGSRFESIEDHAQRALGLDSEEAGRLFDGDNEWADMMRYIAEFTGLNEDALILAVGGNDLPPDPDDDDDYDPDAPCDCDGCHGYRA